MNSEPSPGDAGHDLPTHPDSGSPVGPNPYESPTSGPSSATPENESAEVGTRPEDRVSFGQKVSLGLGAFPNATGTQIIQVMAFPVFQIVLGLNPLLAGVALTIPRLWDAFTDPIMGSISDNFRSKMGRRRPFIIGGAVLMGLTLIGVFMVPKSFSERYDEQGDFIETEDNIAKTDQPENGAGQPSAEAAERQGDAQAASRQAAPDPISNLDWALFTWLVVGAIVFYTAYTIFGVPLISLSYEMTPDYHERTRVMAFWTVFFTAGNIFVGWYYPWVEQFDDPLVGARIIALVIGAGIFIGLGTLPGLFTRERLYVAASKQAKIHLVTAVVETVSNRNMMMLLGMTLSLAFVGAMAAALAVYIVIFFVCGGDRETGSILNAWNGVGYQIMGFAAIPLLTLLSQKIGKRGAMFVVLALAAAGGVAKWFLFVPGGFFEVNKALSLHILLLDPLLNAPVWVALNMLVLSMMADLCDVDEYEHGRRREGVFGAVFTWMQKLGFSLTFLFTGLAVWLSGFDEKLGANQPEGTMEFIRLCFAGFSCAAMLLGMVFLAFYSVSESKAYEVRKVLEARRGKVDAN